MSSSMQLSRIEEQSGRLLAAQAERTAKFLYKTFGQFPELGDVSWDESSETSKQEWLTIAYDLLVCELEMFKFRI